MYILIILYSLSVIKSYPLYDKSSISKLVIKRSMDVFVPEWRRSSYFHNDLTNTEQRSLYRFERALIQNGSIFIDSEKTIGLSNLDLILGLGLGIPLVLVFATLLIFGCCCHRFKCFRSCLSKLYNYGDDDMKSNQNLVDNSKTQNNSSSSKDVKNTKNSKKVIQRSITTEEYLSGNNSSDKKGLNIAKDTYKNEDMKLANNSNNNKGQLFDNESMSDKNRTPINESKDNKNSSDVNEIDDNTDSGITSITSNDNNTTVDLTAKSYGIKELRLAYDLNDNQDLSMTNQLRTVKLLQSFDETNNNENITVESYDNKIVQNDARPISQTSTSTSLSNNQSSTMNMTRTTLFSPSVNVLPTTDVQYITTTFPSETTDVNKQDSILVRAYTLQRNDKLDSIS
ncbi:hypothetical protein I4U23_010535 [Adineta vaga]|nr:hypothetical protein I4U23_010535 [Adineta vaga]